MISQDENNKTNLRNIALQVFSKFTKNVEKSNDIALLLKKEMINNHRDYSFILNIIEGTYKNIILIDYYINYLIKKNSKLPEIIKNILRISIYQIEFMDSVPDSAAINEGVELAKKYGHKGTVGLVNGLLRNFLRKKSEIFDSIDKLNFNEMLGIKYSYPLWIIDYWASFLSKEKVSGIAKSMYDKPEIYIRVNTLKISVDDFCNQLNNKDIKYSKTEITELLKLEQSINVKDIYGFNEGFFYIQDLSAASVIDYLDPQQNEDIIDFCSFPGGKTSFISQRMNNTGKIIALDISEKRKERFLENINRLGCNNIEIIIKDGEEKLDFKNNFDRILVDPPCSGLGVIKRKADIKYLRKKDDVKRLSEIQLKILENASTCLKKDGVLIYSTCTISKVENEDVIEKFLLENDNFKLINIGESKYINIYPDEKDSDGFFIAKIKRVS